VSAGGEVKNWVSGSAAERLPGCFAFSDGADDRVGKVKDSSTFVRQTRGGYLPFSVGLGFRIEIIAKDPV
jgi:hypothetical protein